jgi:H+/Cl- antiporter ClcA
MSATIWVKRSWYARGWLLGAFIVQGLLYGIAHTNPAWMLFPRGEWQNRELMVLVSMVVLLLAAFLMHRFDKKTRGGFLNVYAQTNSGHQLRERLFVGPVLTVESVRAAMTAGILAILLDDREEYLGAPPSETPYWHSIETLIDNPEAVFFLLITGALAASLMTTMAALLCYEYATRFDWKEAWPKTNLLSKGFHFGKFGFYCLMWSLAVVPALLDHRLVFLSILFVFVIMWIYYFFPLQSSPGPAEQSAGAQPAPAEEAVPMPPEAAPAIEQRESEELEPPGEQPGKAR